MIEKLLKYYYNVSKIKLLLIGLHFSVYYNIIIIKNTYKKKTLQQPSKNKTIKYYKVLSVVSNYQWYRV